MRYAVYFLVIQLIVYLIRTMFFTTMIGQAYYDSRYNDNTAYITITILFSIIATVAVCIITALVGARDAEKKRLFRARFKDKKFTLKDAVSLAWRRNLGHTAVYAVFSIPFLIFYSKWGLTYDTAIVTQFEMFYSLQAGFYEITHIGIVGFLMSCAFFFVVSLLLDMIVYKSWNSDRI